jgi:hypothetical protein
MIYRWTQEQWEQRFELRTGEDFSGDGLTSIMGNDRTEQEARILEVEWNLDGADYSGNPYPYMDPYENWMDEAKEAMRGEP